MKLRNLLKIGLPLLGVGALAVSLPLALTSCSDDKEQSSIDTTYENFKTGLTNYLFDLVNTSNEVYQNATDIEIPFADNQKLSATITSLNPNTQYNLLTSNETYIYSIKIDTNLLKISDAPEENNFVNTLKEGINSKFKELSIQFNNKNFLTNYLDVKYNEASHLLEIQIQSKVFVTQYDDVKNVANIFKTFKPGLVETYGDSLSTEYKKLDATSQNVVLQQLNMFNVKNSIASNIAISANNDSIKIEVNQNIGLFSKEFINQINGKNDVSYSLDNNAHVQTITLKGIKFGDKDLNKENSTKIQVTKEGTSKSIQAVTNLLKNYSFNRENFDIFNNEYSNTTTGYNLLQSTDLYKSLLNVFGLKQEQVDSIILIEQPAKEAQTKTYSLKFMLNIGYIWEKESSTELGENANVQSTYSQLDTLLITKLSLK